MPGTLRTFVQFLMVLMGTFALLWLGFIWLPVLFSLIWIVFGVVVACAGTLLLVIRRPASDARPNPDTRRLTRSRDHWIAGVCGGIAEFLGWQPGVVRALWMLLSLLFAGIGGLVIYTILACAMPLPPDRGGKFRLEDFRVQ